MGDVTEILLRIMVRRRRNKIKPENEDEQFGCVVDKGTKSTIYILRTLSERIIEMYRGMYVCVCDHTKAFDRMCQEEVIINFGKCKHLLERCEDN